jgi:hypothetical protein
MSVWGRARGLYTVGYEIKGDNGKIPQETINVGMWNTEIGRIAHARTATQHQENVFLL